MTKKEWDELKPGDIVRHEIRGEFLVTNREPHFTICAQVAHFVFVSDSDEWAVARKANFCDHVPEVPAKPTVADRIVKAHRDTATEWEFRDKINKILLEEKVSKHHFK